MSRLYDSEEGIRKEWWSARQSTVQSLLASFLSGLQTAEMKQEWIPIHTAEVTRGNATKKGTTLFIWK